MTSESYRMWQDDEGIVHLEYVQGAVLNLEIARRSVAQMLELTGRGKAPLLVDHRGIKFSDRESRSYYATSPQANNATTGVALLVGSLMNSTLASFFLFFNKPPFPCRIFTSEEEALAWLKEL